MIKKAICINHEHTIIVKDYINLIIDCIDDVTGKNESKFEDFIDVSNIIINHHNNYNLTNLKTGNFLDFMSIIPTNFSIMTSGFLAGIETQKNRKKCRAYRLMLSDYAFRMIEDLEKLTVTSE